jgi:hypothetical protein
MCSPVATFLFQCYSLEDDHQGIKIKQHQEKKDKQKEHLAISPHIFYFTK